MSLSQPTVYIRIGSHRARAKVDRITNHRVEWYTFDRLAEHVHTVPADLADSVCAVKGVTLLKRGCPAGNWSPCWSETTAWGAR